MDEAPHIAVRTFERLILFPIDACVLVAGIIFLIEKAWLFGAFLIIMSLFFAIVGQAL
jgi:ABC-type multidrug transport system permease subunit